MTRLHSHSRASNAASSTSSAQSSDTGTPLSLDYPPSSLASDAAASIQDSLTGISNPHVSAAKTTALDAWIQLTKAYIGPGCLSLPWAVSQLGLPLGVVVIGGVALWTSYNCWTVVSLKRQMQREQPHRQQITYPDVGGWAYDKQFKNLLLACICTQQLAICTIFLSFVGENLAAILEKTLGEAHPPSHVLVITLSTPLALLLSCLPNLRALTPAMVAAAISLMIGFALLGIVILEEWPHRPHDTTHHDIWDIEWAQIPTAFCAILYSYEGICVILPVESALAKPEQFQSIFWSSMAFTAAVFASVAGLCVVAFGDVTNGSVIAFLMESLEDESVKAWLYAVNAFCSLAVLLTYPLQLFPTLELIGPWMSNVYTTGALPFLHSPVAVPSCENRDDGVIGEYDYHPLDSPQLSAPVAAFEEPPNTSSTEQELQLAVPSNSDFQQSPAFATATTIPGDSPLLRLALVAFTYIMAIAVPNVQLLVSLAGALSGSATALIVPPLLQLAYLHKKQEEEEEAVHSASANITVVADNDTVEEGDIDDSNPLLGSMEETPSRATLQWKKWECYVLFCSGVVVCVFGTGAACSDIVRVYLGK